MAIVARRNLPTQSLDALKNPESSVAVRYAPLDIDPSQFREVGHRLVDLIGDMLEAMPAGPITSAESPAQIRAALGGGALPVTGESPSVVVEHATELLTKHSLYNGHPRFMGFITSSAAPIGALAELLAAAVNPNLGGWLLSPMASEIEAQTVRWIAELIGYPTDCGGLLVSGGNVANFVGLWAARRARAGAEIRRDGSSAAPELRIYASAATHTWIEKAADLSGLGTRSIRKVRASWDERLDVQAVRSAIEQDLADGAQPFMIVGSAGTVSTGAIDPLFEIASLCREFDLWFHIDGAYGAPAALLDTAPADLQALALADSVAIDPHKWLYAPLEAGCTLVRSTDLLRNTFSYHPPYYPDKDPDNDAGLMYYELGPQNSRGFRALKVWMAMRQVGRDGYRRMIADDIRLARMLFDVVDAHTELEAVTNSLSITTFRFVPEGVDASDASNAEFLNDLNRRLMVALQKGGEVFLTNAVVSEIFLLRACIVNFRTTESDVRAIPGIVTRVGRSLL